MFDQHFEININAGEGFISQLNFNQLLLDLKDPVHLHNSAQTFTILFHTFYSFAVLNMNRLNDKEVHKPFWEILHVNNLIFLSPLLLER